MTEELLKSKCYYCTEKLHGGNRTRDHIWPKSKGGKLSKKNKVFACRKCNSSKGDLTLDEWKMKIQAMTPTRKTKYIYDRREIIIPILEAMIIEQEKQIIFNT